MADVRVNGAEGRLGVPLTVWAGRAPEGDRAVRAGRGRAGVPAEAGAAGVPSEAGCSEAS